MIPTTMVKILCISCLLCFSFLGYAQTTNISQQKKFSSEQVHADLQVLYASLKDVHPSLYSFISEDSLLHIEDDFVNESPDSLTELEIQVIVRKFIKSIRCGHTTARPSKEWYTEQANDSKILPIDIWLLKNKAYIKQAHHKDSILTPGLEIVSIDGMSIEQIITEMRSIQQIDGYATTFEDKSIQKLFRTYYLFLYGRSNEYTIGYLDQQNNLNYIDVQGGISKAMPPTPSTPPDLKISGSKFYVSDDSQDVAVLDIDNFPSKKYKKYYKSVFKEIKNKKIEHLVIDLRGNGGGYFPNGNTLLRYLLDEKFYMDFNRPKNKVHKQPYLKMGVTSKITKTMFKLMPDKDKSDPNRNFAIRYKPKKKYNFDGQLYVLIDGGTFSMGSLVASKLNHYTNCTLIGEETGGGEMGSNAILMYNLTLPETNIRVNIPYYHIDHKVKLEQTGNGVMPHINVNYEVADLIDKRDKEMEAVKMLIQKQKL